MLSICAVTASSAALVADAAASPAAPMRGRGRPTPTPVALDGDAPPSGSGPARSAAEYRSKSDALTVGGSGWAHYQPGEISRLAEAGRKQQRRGLGALGKAAGWVQRMGLWVRGCMGAHPSAPASVAAAPPPVPSHVLCHPGTIGCFPNLRPTAEATVSPAQRAHAKAQARQYLLHCILSRESALTRKQHRALPASAPSPMAMSPANGASLGAAPPLGDSHSGPASPAEHTHTHTTLSTHRNASSSPCRHRRSNQRAPAHSPTRSPLKKTLRAYRAGARSG